MQDITRAGTVKTFTACSDWFPVEHLLLSQQVRPACVQQQLLLADCMKTQIACDSIF